MSYISETISHQCLQHSGLADLLFFVELQHSKKKKSNYCMPQNDGQKGEKLLQ